MDREERIWEQIQLCTCCGSFDFPKRSDCIGCTDEVDAQISAEADRISAITREIASAGGAPIGNGTPWDDVVENGEI